MWTRFMDMHSGGGLKEKPYSLIFIEAPEHEAEVIFANRFGHSPNRVTCTCCGEDYVVDDAPTFTEASAYDRLKSWNSKERVSLKEFLNRKDVLVIRKKDIKPKERLGDVPIQGYIWVG